jgi:PAS domain S-box-containing protein
MSSKLLPVLPRSASDPSAPITALATSPTPSPARLADAEPFWETVVEMLSDAVFLVGPDRTILYWNRAAELLTGYSRDEVIGSHCLRAIHCNVCEHRCGVFEFSDVKDVPLVLRTREGHPVETIKNATVVRDAEGKPLFGIEVLRDVTSWNERERASTEARRLAESQKALVRGMLDSVTEGIIGVSHDGTIRFVSTSAEQALGIREQDVLGRPAQDVVGTEVADLVGHVVRAGAEVSRSRVDVSPTGATLVPVAVTVSPLVLPGEPRSAMVLVRDLRAEERQQRERMRSQAFAYGTLISRSPRMQEVFDLVDQVAPTTTTILVHGDSGTGKELVAREIHKRSSRASGPFHAVNCAAIATEILESEFFGHERGAFTGAIAQKRGRFEVAHTGTIFLDEVGELPLELQGKLLRVLEERTFERVGGTTSLQVDVRVIAATNRNLMQMVRDGRFREDLFYRLRVVPIRLPPLRERMEDVELLANLFLERIARREGKPIVRLGADAMRGLLDHPWPGNVRELANAMEYVAVVTRESVARPQDLPREIRLGTDTFAPDTAPTTVPEPQAQPPATDALIGDERARIRAALLSTQYRHGDAAAMLGMHRTTLYRKRQKYGI